MAETHLVEFAVDVKGFNIHAVKGYGAYGIVYNVTVDGMPCIAKRVHNVLTCPELGADEKAAMITKFREECLLTSQLRHPNVVHFVGVHYGRSTEELSLILECLHTDLACYLTGTDKKCISLPTKLSIVLDISYGILYLHTRDPPIIHRDLTANNILLTGDLRAKIADLGVSKVLDIHRQAELSQTKVPGSQYYMPPEALQENPQYDYKLDVFSFGHLMIFIATQKFPKVHESISNQALREGTIQILKRKVSLELMGRDHPLDSLVLRCLLDDPKRRPTALEVNTAAKKLQSRHINPAIAEHLGKLKERVSEHENDIRSLLDEKTQLKTEMASYKEYLDEERAHLTQHSLKEKVHTDEYQSLQDEIARLQKQLKHASKLPKRSKDLHATVMRLESDMELLQRDKDSLAKQVKELETSKDVLTASVKDLVFQIRMVKDENEQLKKLNPRADQPRTALKISHQPRPTKNEVLICGLRPTLPPFQTASCKPVLQHSSSEASMPNNNHYTYHPLSCPTNGPGIGPNSTRTVCAQSPDDVLGDLRDAGNTSSDAEYDYAIHPRFPSPSEKLITRSFRAHPTSPVCNGSSGKTVASEDKFSASESVISFRQPPRRVSEPTVTSRPRHGYENTKVELLNRKMDRADHALQPHLKHNSARKNGDIGSHPRNAHKPPQPLPKPSKKDPELPPDKLLQ